MRIKRKFIFEVTVLSGLLMFASYVAINNTLQVERNFSNLNDELIPTLGVLKDMRLIASNILTSTLEYALVDNDPSEQNSQAEQELSNISDSIQNGKEQFNQLLTLYMQKSSDPNGNEYPDKIKTQWEKFETLSNKFVEYRKRGISGQEFTKIKDEFKDSKNALFREIDFAILANEGQVEEKGHMVSDLVRSTTMIVSLVVLIFMTVFITMRYFILKSILMPILKIRNATKNIANGSFGERIREIPSDEIGELSNDINQMAAGLEASQEKLLKSEKLSTVGTLAARMAHDLRNPLAIIMVSVERIKGKYNDKEDPSFDTIKRAIERMTHQIQDVLDFVKITPLKIEETSLLGLLNRVVEIQSLPKDVSISLPQNDAIIECDQRKIEVLLINLIKNALDAVKDSGTITVRFVDLGESIRIEIEDSGSGVPEEHKDKIFDPLFTTKQKGTGLGLSSVRNIVEEHGGTINLSNKPTTFAVTLPKKPASTTT